MGVTNYILFVGVSCLLMLTGCLTSQKHLNENASLFIFGDSLFDSGNNNYINTYLRANFWPYGESYFNPPTGRFSNGRIITDFIATHARLPFIPNYMDPRNSGFGYGANFASGGAGALVETLAGNAIALKTQLQQFSDLAKHYRQSLGDKKAKKMLSDAVYIFSCGINDYSINNFKSPIGSNESILYPYTHEQFVGMVIGNLSDVLMGIYEQGGKKIAFVDLPPFACYPGIRAGRPNFTCNEELEIIINLHNQKLSDKLQDLENRLEGFMYAKFNYNTELKKRIKNPSKYGLKVGDTACCGSGPFRGINNCGGKIGNEKFELCDNVDEYLLFDTHPTEVVCRKFANLFWNGDSNFTTPYNLKALFQVQGKRSSTTRIEVI